MLEQLPTLNQLSTNYQLSTTHSQLPTVNSLHRRKVCVTGRLVTLTHDELARLVVSCGGTFVRFPYRGSMILVVGENGWPSENDGSPSRIFDRARRLRAFGYPIDFQTEDEFLERLGVVERDSGVGRLLTISDVRQILGVSPAQIRRWVRSGLIEPVEQPCRLAYFDFHQVAFAKRLCELLAAGVSLSAIREGVEKVRRWQAEQHLPVVQWAKLTDDGRVLTRLNDVLVDGGGQLYFDFEFVEDQSSAIAVSTRLPEDGAAVISELFDEAIRLEDAGELEPATNLYQRAILLEPHDATLYFNLGNIHYQLGQYELAVDCYQRATQCDPHYAEAWNNLGSAWVARQQHENAIQAWQTAVSLLPTYADAHCNLADLFLRLGRAEEAAAHRQAYRKCSAAELMAQRRSGILRVFREGDDAEDEEREG